MRLHAAVVIGLVCVAVTAAHAQQPSQKYNDEYQAGIDAYRLGKYDEATAHLEAAKAIDATLPGPWRWLAAVAQANADWPACVANAREALRLNPKSSEAGNTKKLHDDCRAAWGKPAFTGTYEVGQGALAVTTDQVGASVEVNKLKYGSTPMQPRPFAAGDAEVMVSKTGFLSQTRKVTVVEGIVVDVDFVLEVDPNAAGNHVDTNPVQLTKGWIKVVPTPATAEILVDGQNLALDPQGRFEVEAGDHQVLVRAPGHEPLARKVHVTKGQLISVDAALRSQAAVDSTRKKGRIAVAVGIGVVLVGAVTGALSVRDANQAHDLWAIETSRPPGIDTSDIQPIHTRADIDAIDQRSRTFGLVSDIAYGCGIAAIGVGAYFLVKGRPAGEHPTVAVAPTAGGAMAVGEVRW